MTVTIADVARAAGVSPATASRALSGHPAVLPDTRERVAQAAESLQYRVNPVARALRAGSSDLVALVVTNLHNPAIQVVAEVVQQRGQAEGYDVVIATTNGDATREERLVDALTGRRVDGLIVMSTDGGVDRLNELASRGLPVVQLIRQPGGLTVPSVVYDDRLAGETATEHLLDLGHERIAFVGGPVDTRSGRERHAGYAAALGRRGLGVDELLIRSGPFSASFGSEAVDALRRTDATALVLANHEAMFSALQATSRHDVAVPDTWSIVAIEDDPALSWWHPAITAVDVRPEVLAERAMDGLLAQIRGGQPQEQADPVPIRLIPRASTARPR